jgi:hypothetical protein
VFGGLDLVTQSYFGVVSDNTLQIPRRFTLRAQLVGNCNIVERVERKLVVEELVEAYLQE